MGGNSDEIKCAKFLTLSTPLWRRLSSSAHFDSQADPKPTSHLLLIGYSCGRLCMFDMVREDKEMS